MPSSATWPCAALSRADLAPRTTVRVGGRAEWLLEPATPAELEAAWCEARERGYLPRILGGGANLLIADGDHPWVVITTERMNRLFRVGEHELEDEAILAGWAAHLPEGQRLVAWAGAGIPGVVRAARDLGWSGLEGLVGVPGHMGGGVAMNAGGRWGNLWDVVERVSVLMPDGQVRELLREECNPRYRDANLGAAIVLAVILRLKPGNKVAIREQMRDYLQQKSAAQPVTERSSGCVFKNPDPELSDGRGAGKLIEDCGGKGLARGDAIVSPKHGNFILNRGQARATDVLGLLEDLRTLVADKTGIQLETEVKLWAGAGAAR
jgi:UDP-N-acetylmuramate dehydrogenase